MNRNTNIKFTCHTIYVTSLHPVLPLYERITTKDRRREFAAILYVIFLPRIRGTRVCIHIDLRYTQHPTCSVYCKHHIVLQIHHSYLVTLFRVVVDLTVDGYLFLVCALECVRTSLGVFRRHTPTVTPTQQQTELYDCAMLYIYVVIPHTGIFGNSFACLSAPTFQGIHFPPPPP